MGFDIEFLEQTIIDSKPTDYSADLIIVGGGPAAIVASQYADRGGITTIMFEPRELARKVTHHDVHFLPGLAGPISGPECAKTLREQVKGKITKEIVKTIAVKAPKLIHVFTDKQRYVTKTVLIATGLRKRNVGLEGEEKFRSRGVHIVLDAAPNTDCVKGLVQLDQQGFITTEENLMTNVPGIFAAGDVRTKYLRQVITAAADGATAALAIENYLRE